MHCSQFIPDRAAQRRASGIVVACQAERSQGRNRELALKMLKAKLYQIEQDKKRAEIDRQYGEKGDIAWGNQIRSYVFQPYEMVKDHRTGAETSNVQEVMDGKIDIFIQAKLRGQKAAKGEKSEEELFRTNYALIPGMDYIFVSLKRHLSGEECDELAQKYFETHKQLTLPRQAL